MEIARIIEGGYDVHSYNILPCNESKIIENHGKR
jgi:hypothetical protein